LITLLLSGHVANSKVDRNDSLVVPPLSAAAPLSRPLPAFIVSPASQFLITGVGVEKVTEISR
jgi:predicted benzoate:H+ symporter BenE